MSHEVERLVLGSGQKAWHKLGAVLPGEISVEEAIRLGLGNATYSSVPIFIEGQGEGSYDFVDGRYAIKRDQDNKVYYVGSEHYQVYQPRECFDFLDELTGQGLKYESCGSLFDGAVIFLLANMPHSLKIAGDEVGSYVALVQTYNGKGFSVCDTPTRIVCNNTLNLALNDAKQANRLWKTKHMGGELSSKVEKAKEFLTWSQNRMKALAKEAENLLKIQVKHEQRDLIINTLFPKDKDTSKRKVKIVDERRSLLYQALNAEDLENFRNTGWGFVNAIADFVDHSPPVRSSETYEDQRFLDVINGHPILDLAHKCVLALAN